MSNRKNVGLRYGEFEFPSEQGFSGSAGRTEVKGYMRGGSVKKRNTPCKKPKLAKGTTKAAMGGYMGPEREITVDDVKITTPARGMKKGGRSTHDKLKAHGKQMGYKQGGQVRVKGLRPGSKSIGQSPDDIGLKNYKPRRKKNTSGEFKAKRGKQDSMDHGVQPARRGKNARSQQEREAGGTGRLKPGLKKGGKVCKAEGGYMGAPAASGGAELAAKAIKKAKATLHRKPRLKKPEAARRASGKGMPKNVKAKGGVVGKGGAAR